MIVEGYTLHLYCDDPDHPWDGRAGALYRPGEFSGYRLAVAYREARQAGWSFYLEGKEKKCRCPHCRSMRRRS